MDNVKRSRRMETGVVALLIREVAMGFANFTFNCLWKRTSRKEEEESSVIGELVDSRRTGEIDRSLISTCLLRILYLVPDLLLPWGILQTLVLLKEQENGRVLLRWPTSKRSSKRKITSVLLSLSSKSSSRKDL